jgi:glycosyltransferase involved in cell wall biosynthesis
MSGKNISVVLATFNGSKYIVKQIDSILAQTTLPEEIIICDDCSTDETVSLIKPYLKNKQIKLFVNESRLGVFENFKKAASLANNNNWLVFGDQDDIWLPLKLSKLAAAMSILDDEITPSLVYSDLAVIDNNDNIMFSSFWERQKIKPEKIKLSTLLYGNVVTGCTMIINRPLADEFFLVDISDYFHDEWLGLIAYSFGNAKILNESLVLYRQHETNVTFSAEYKTLGFIDSVKDVFKYLIKKKKFLSHEFDIAKAFSSKYQGKLSEKQSKIISKFIKQEDKNYILQRINRRIAYR